LDESAVLRELEELARSLDVEVRYENLKREGGFTSGGLCRLKGRYLLVINSKATNRDKIEALASALTRFDLSHIYLKPGLRDFLDRFPAK
jgi:N-dimethylarginine dimethylaminohydrolase